MAKFIRMHKALFIWLVIVSVTLSASLVFIAFILQSIVDIALQQDWESFKNTGIATVLFLVFFGLIFYTYGVLVAKLNKNVTVSLRQYIVECLAKKSIQQYTAEPSSSYLSMLSNDVKQIEDNYMNPLINMIQHSVLFLLSLAALLYLNVYVTLVLIGCVLLMFIAPSLLAKVLEAKQTAVSKQMVKFTAHAKDFLEGFDVLYSYRILRSATKRFYAENELTAKVKYEADHVNAINHSLSNILGIIVQFAVILLSGYLIIKGKLTGGGLVALVQLSGTIVSPIVSIFSELPKVKSVKGLVSRIVNLQHEEAEHADITQTDVNVQFSAIHMNNIEFSYANSDKKVLHNISQTFEKGKKYVIIGSSGCGKTTLVKLIAGQLQPTQGKILFDQHQIVNRQQLVEQSAMVSQKVFLFDDTLKHNISLYEHFTEEQWQLALERSGVNKFIGQSDVGLDCMVGEGGAILSGGQKQRVSIARALIRNKPMIILDEGTSALDIQTSYEVESQLLVQKQLTLLTITHQINEQLLRQYDSIIYMEQGQIAEVGSYEELMLKNGKFKLFSTIEHASLVHTYHNHLLNKLFI